jgi:hypothetical protein
MSLRTTVHLGNERSAATDPRDPSRRANERVSRPPLGRSVRAERDRCRAEADRDKEDEIRELDI